MTKIQASRFVLAVLLTVSIAFSQEGAGVPAGSIQAATPGGVRYNQSGDRIVDFFDIHAAELRSVMRQISAYSGIDVVVSDAAKATVTLSVTNKSWREILSIVCMVYNLAYIQEQSFIYVMPAAEAAARGINRGPDGAVTGTGEAPSTLTPIPGPAAEMLSPLVREVVPLRYTTAAEMSPAITPFLSQRGRMTPVQHTNALIIVDTDENLQQIKHLIGQIDIQTPQISISCKIIEVSSEVMQQIGINWHYTDAANNITAGQFWGGEDGMPMFNPLGHMFTYGLLSPEKFGIALDYLFHDNNTEMVAQPQITTLNNKEATIFMGQQIPINTLDDAGNTITQMVNAGTRLTVTPYVSGDGKIMLSLSPSKESYAPTPQGPVINEQSANTNVLVNNGETVMIAGLTSNEKMNTERGIPVLKDIPVLGHLFKWSSTEARKRDLIIFVTPHIIHSGI
jgi:type IV pilus assembly protein PilQ